MIFSCCLYAGERALLKIRIEELALLEPLKKFMPVRHVVVEANSTFTGKPKEFTMLQEDINKYGIHYHPFVFANPATDPWENEKRLRNEIKSALFNLGATEGDTVIISDVDEIPRAYAVQHYRPEMGLAALQMDIYHFYLNTRYQSQTWRAPRIMPWSYLQDKEPDDVRRSGFNLALVNAGYHYTYQGSINTIMNKFAAFSHQESEVQQYANAELLSVKRNQLRDVWGDSNLQVVPDGDLPYYVRTNKEEFKQMLYV